MRFIAMPTEDARRYRAGAPDANGQPPERQVSDGGGNPCRHCLDLIPKGAPMLVLAHRPFAGMHPYSEAGPVFLCAGDCPRGGGEELPAMLASPDYTMRGYDAAERIVYGTGSVVARDRIAARAGEILADPRVAFVHVRSARNTCFQCRIER